MTQIHVRIDKSTEDKIKLLQYLEQMETDTFINLSELERLIISAGVETLINQKGGIDSVTKKVNSYIDKTMEETRREMEAMKHE